MNIDKMIDKILEHEGGFVNHPADRGGATNFGVTQKTYSEYLDRAATVEDVRGMDINEAEDIYRSVYYKDPGLDQLPEDIQPQLFDCSINHGPKRAIKFLQDVCNLAGFGMLIVDGECGPKTAAVSKEAHRLMGNYLINAIADERLIFYDSIVSADPSQKVFLKGWRKRAESWKVKI